jgi:hypothetical protein
MPARFKKSPTITLAKRCASASVGTEASEGCGSKEGTITSAYRNIHLFPVSHCDKKPKIVSFFNALIERRRRLRASVVGFNNFELDSYFLPDDRENSCYGHRTQ